MSISNNVFAVHHHADLGMLLWQDRFKKLVGAVAVRTQESVRLEKSKSNFNGINTRLVHTD